MLHPAALLFRPNLGVSRTYLLACLLFLNSYDSSRLLSMSSRAFIFISTLVVAQRAAAHGYLGSVAIDGTTYTGPTPSANPSAAKSTSEIRQVADISPVQGADALSRSLGHLTDDMLCECRREQR